MIGRISYLDDFFGSRHNPISNATQGEGRPACAFAYPYEWQITAACNGEILCVAPLVQQFSCGRSLLGMVDHNEGLLSQRIAQKSADKGKVSR